MQGQSQDTGGSSDSKKLAELLQDSTSDSKDDVDVYEVKKNEDLHFSVKKNSVMSRMASRMRNGKMSRQEVKLKAKKDFFNEGIWAELELKNHSLWCFIKTTEEKTTVFSIDIYPSKNSEAELLGNYTVEVASELIVALPKMTMTFLSAGDSWNIEAKALEQVVIKKAEGLITQSQDGKIYIFDDAGDAAAEGESVKDCRKHCPAVDSMSFYRGGAEPFVCFNMEDFKYCYPNMGSEEGEPKDEK